LDHDVNENLSSSTLRGEAWHQTIYKGLMPKYDAIFCLTIYNENKEMLSDSISALKKSIEHRHSQSSKTEIFAVFIIADGIEYIDQSTRVYLEQLGFSFDFDSKTKEVNFELKSLCLDGGKGDRHQRGSLDVLLCIKSFNQGKLNSHWWFYHEVCGKLKPDYCFQIDAGSIPDECSVDIMLTGFIENPNIHAVSPSIFVVEKKNASLLESWQFINFYSATILSWPAEMFSGHMSVIPGQFSAVRYKAVSSTEGREDGSVLDTYFKGLGDMDHLDRALYLAEDRVLATEINYGKQDDGKVAFLKDACATTDYCTSWRELLKQRRRWNLSIMSSRLQMIKKSFKSKKEESLIKMLMPLILQFTNIAADWMLIGVYLVLLFGFSKLADPASAADSFFVTLSSSAVAVAVICILIQILTSFFKLNKFTSALLISSTYLHAVALLCLGAGSLFYLEKNYHFYLMLMFLLSIILILPLVALVSRQHNLKAYLINYAKSIVFLWPVRLMMSIYSIINCNDFSWGTKGLDNKSEKMGETRWGDLMFRAKYIGVWILSNVAVFLTLMYVSASDKEKIINLSFSTVLLLDFVIIIMALLGACLFNEKRVTGLKSDGTVADEIL